MNPPSKERPLELRCTACDGQGSGETPSSPPVPWTCQACGGRGVIELTGCPWKQVTADVDAAIKAERFAKAGHWPLAGGWLDQSQVLLEAVEFVQLETRAWKRAAPETEDED